MNFPLNDKYWLDVEEFINANLQDARIIAAPNEFIDKFGDRILLYSALKKNHLKDSCQSFVIHKGRMEDMDYTLLNEIANQFIPFFSNEVFVVFSSQASDLRLDKDSIHIKTFFESLEMIPQETQTDDSNNYTTNLQVMDNISSLNIKEFANLTRSNLELISRRYSQTVYLGDSIILCRVLAKYMCYVEAKDASLTPHLCLNGYWESWLTQTMLSLLKSGFYCIDVGANCGYYSLIMADAVGESGHVLSVEPNPRLSYLLTKSLNINGFSDRTKVSEKAVSDTIGEKVRLVIPEGSFWGSASIVEISDVTETQSFEVETITIDELTKDYPRVDFIKIDAEGAEELIWKGMQQTIEKNRNIVIIMEFASDRVYNPRPFLEDIKEKGFLIRYIDNDSQIKSLSIEECISGGLGKYWDLILRRKNAKNEVILN